MSQPRNARKARAQARRTKRHEAKRRAVRNASKSLTIAKRKRQAMSYRQAMRAAQVGVLHHLLMGRGGPQLLRGPQKKVA